MNNQIIYIANTGFALYNFRLPFMKHLVSKGWEVTAVACDEANYFQEFKLEGIRFINIYMDHKGKNPFSDFLLIYSLARIYRRERPQIVHHFTIKPVIFGSIAAKLSGIPCIVNTITGLGYVFERGGWLEWLTRNLYLIALQGRPRVIFQNSDDHSLFLKERITRRGQCSIIPGSGVDTSSLIPSNDNTGNSVLTFLMVARMLWPKGVKEFVKAAERIKREFPDMKFIMAGGVSGGGAMGNPQAVPEKWLLEVNRGGAVKWVGRIAHSEVMKMMDEAQVVVLPSYYPEGIPKSLIEAASKARAIITTDTPGCRDVVVHGKNGFLVPPRDVDNLVVAMREFIAKPGLAQKMGWEGRKRAVELFDDNIVFDKTLQVYETILHH